MIINSNEKVVVTINDEEKQIGVDCWIDKETLTFKEAPQPNDKISIRIVKENGKTNY
jgi:hypothetical protein